MICGQYMMMLEKFIVQPLLESSPSVDWEDVENAQRRQFRREGANELRAVWFILIRKGFPIRSKGPLQPHNGAYSFPTWWAPFCPWRW